MESQVGYYETGCSYMLELFLMTQYFYSQSGIEENFTEFYQKRDTMYATKRSESLHQLFVRVCLCYTNYLSIPLYTHS